MKNLPEGCPNFAIFQTKSGKVNVDVLFQGDTLWLTQKKIAELCEKGRSTMPEPLKNIFTEGELEENAVCRNFPHTAEDGTSYNTQYYNLRAITAVGYRVHSHRATEVRRWATEILHEYIVKGFAMDDEHLKPGHHFGQDYFDGVENMEAGTLRKDTQVGRVDCEELPQQRAFKGAGADCLSLSGFGRKQSHARGCDKHEGLGCFSG